MTKWIWRLFYLLVAMTIVSGAGSVLKVSFVQNVVFETVLLGLPVLLLFLHSNYTLGRWRSLLLITLSAGVGWFMETMGLKYGVIFGGRYVYEGNPVMLGGVPVAVVSYWAVFIYVGYSLTNSFRFWLNMGKPKITDSPIARVLLLVALDGVLVTIIDLFMDPIQARLAWRWLDGGAYFGVPIGNFGGWFLTTVMATGVFRLVEYFWPQSEGKKDVSVYLLPAFVYGLLAISYGISARELGLYGLMIVGLGLMVPIVVANLYLYTRYRKTAL